MLQKAGKNLAAEWRRREALREATGWVYLPELLRYLKQGGRGEETRFGLKPPKSEFAEFMEVLFAMFFGMLALFADEDEKKSGHAEEMQTA